jgi:hypothetical protein
VSEDLDASISRVVPYHNITRHHNPEVRDVSLHRHEDLKSCTHRGRFPLRFPTKILYAFLFSNMLATCPPHLSKRKIKTSWAEVSIVSKDNRKDNDCVRSVSFSIITASSVTQLTARVDQSV